MIRKKLKYYTDAKIEDDPFTEEYLDNELKKVDLVYHLGWSKKKRIINWIKRHSMEKGDDEEVMYIHRYPKAKDCMIGVKRIRDIDYII